MGWLIISTILLTIPGSAFPKETWLSKIWFDKWVHIGMFAIMTFLWCWAFHNKQPLRLKFSKLFIVIGIFCLLYGVAMEFVQEYVVVNRSFDFGDIVADSIGCVVGVLFSRRAYKKN